jgi:ATP-dependent Clp protease ATP-binding subunit ClpC
MGLLAQIAPTVKDALSVAQDEARGLGHGYIGTEHVLIALLGADSTSGNELRRQGATVEAARVAAQSAFEQIESPNRFVPDEVALSAVGVDLDEVRRRAEAEFGPGAVPMRVGAPPFTPRVKAVLERAVGIASREARPAQLNDVVVAILDDGDCVAAKAIEGMTIDVAAVRAAAT